MRAISSGYILAKYTYIYIEITRGDAVLISETGYILDISMGAYTGEGGWAVDAATRRGRLGGGVRSGGARGAYVVTGL